MTIKERPYDYNWSKNDIRYVFQLSAAVNTSAQIRIKYAPATGGIFTVLLTLSDLIPDSTGLIYVYIQDYLNSLLEYTVPQGTQFVLPATSQCCQFYIEYRETLDGADIPAWETGEADFVRYVLKGGVEVLKQSGNNFFINYFNTSKPFLTWLPGNRFVYADQLAFLCFLNTGGTAVGYKLNFAFADVAGATYTYTYTFTEDDRLFHLDVSPQNDDFPAFAANLYYYDVQVTDSSDIALTEVYRMYVEYRPVYEYWDLFWHNSLGGFDGGRVVGETTISIDRGFKENGAGKDVTAAYNKVRAGGLFHTAISKRNTFKGDIGWQKNAEENEALQEILLSSSIYHLLQDMWLPVLNLQKSQDLHTSKSTIFNFPIQWQTANEEVVFTPKAKLFGIGTLPSLCTGVGFGEYGGMPDGEVGLDYYTSIPLTGSTPIYIISTPGLPDGLHAMIVDDQLIISGTLQEAGTDILITVLVANCEQAVFQDTIDVAASEAPTGTHWDNTEFVEVDDPAVHVHERKQIIGEAGEDVTITVTGYVNNNGGTLSFDGGNVTTVGQTFLYTLDGSGLSDLFDVEIVGAVSPPPGASTILGKFTITAASGGSIGSPVDYVISKVF